MARPERLPSRAPFAGAFFVSLLHACAAAAAPPCPAERYDETVVGAHVYDGDTLRLVDGRRVRLLGINTPEIGRDGRPSEPLADAALRVLEQAAGPGATLRLRLDEEREDRYGRMLAHVYADDGENLQARLLEAGLATTLVVPPNVWASDCYAALERGARAARRGLWALARYAPVEARRLPTSARGFRLVRGTVGRVGESKGNFWLDFTPGVSIRVPKERLDYFAPWHPREALGQRFEARGWVQRRRGQLRITVSTLR